MRPLSFFLVCILAGAVSAAQTELLEQDYAGWKKCFVFQSSNLRATVVPQIGGRIVRFEINGQNILFDPVESRGKSIDTTADSFWAGGYQIDIGPEIRGVPEHRAMWMGPHQTQRLPGVRLRAVSPIDAATGMQLNKEIELDGTAGVIRLTHVMRNLSQDSKTYCLWDRTLCEGGGFALIRLNPKSRFPAGWSLREKDKLVGPDIFDGKKPSHPQVRIMDGVLVAKTGGERTKLGVDTTAGWIAYVRGKLLFVKYFSVGNDLNRYTDGGNVVELYWDNRVAELEPLSPETSLAPGKSWQDLEEAWSLQELAEPVTTYEAARKIVEKIPASPIKAKTAEAK